MVQTYCYTCKRFNSFLVFTNVCETFFFCKYFISNYLHYSCIHEVIYIREINNNSIIFMADDADTNRVEFIIRRCSDVSIK